MKTPDRNANKKRHCVIRRRFESSNRPACPRRINVARCRTVSVFSHSLQELCTKLADCVKTPDRNDNEQRPCASRRCLGSSKSFSPLATNQCCALSRGQRVFTQSARVLKGSVLARALTEPCFPLIGTEVRPVFGRARCIGSPARLPPKCQTRS